jgi:membrane-associated phospholipid phosphatase
VLAVIETTNIEQSLTPIERITQAVSAIFHLLVVLITNWWKVSVHTTAIAGLLVVLAYPFGSIVFPFFGLIPLVGASRLILKRHTFAQVLVGAAIGVLMTALQIRLFFDGV